MQEGPDIFEKQPYIAFSTVMFPHVSTAEVARDDMQVNATQTHNVHTSQDEYIFFLIGNLRLQVKSALIAEARSPPAQGNLRTTLKEYFNLKHLTNIGKVDKYFNDTFREWHLYKDFHIDCL